MDPRQPPPPHRTPPGAVAPPALRGIRHAFSREWRGLEPALEALTEDAAAALGVQRVGVWILDRARTRIRCLDLFDAGAGRHVRAGDILRDECPAYFDAVDQDRMVAVENALADARTRERAAYLEATGVAALLDAPVWVGGRVAGVVCHEHVGAPREWSEAEVATASAVAVVASLLLATAERETARTALRERDEIYRRVFDASPAALAQLDLSLVQLELRALRERTGGRCAEYLAEHEDELLRLAGLLEVLRLNQAAVALYGAASEEALRERLTSLVLPESLPLFERVVLALASGETSVEGEATHRTVDGRHLHVRVSCQLPRTPSVLDPMVVSVVDLTEQKSGENLLREIAQELGTETGERYFQAAVRFLGVRMGADLALVGEVDEALTEVRTTAAWRDGQEAENFVYALAGSPCGEVVGHRPCVHPDGVCEIFPDDAALVRLGARAYVGAPLFASDGRALGIVVAVFRKPLTNSRTIESALKIFASRASAELERLTTDRHRLALEEQLVRAQRLESVGRLAGGVAHDFNNLLAPIMAYAEMALDAVPGDVPLAEDLKEILGAAERASKVTRQLLAFSRRQVLEMTTVDLNETVRGFQRMLRTVVREDIHLETRLSDGIPGFRGDQGQVEQVLLNLILNAQDAMPEGGRLTVATFTRTVEDVESLAPGNYVCLEVRDTGTGMDDFTRAHIFEPFFTTKPSHEGTGLGLATVYGIVQQHGGGVTVESELGKGSTFHICFPAALETVHEGPAKEAGAGRASGSERIMVVEDEAAVRRLVVTVLRRHGYDVVEASSPLQGLEMALDPQLSLDLLVTDVVMPQMDGVELYRRVSQIRPELPVLYLSGYAHDVIAARGVQTVNLLEKPFTLQELTDRVRQALDA